MKFCQKCGIVTERYSTGRCKICARACVRAWENKNKTFAKKYRNEWRRKVQAPKQRAARRAAVGLPSTAPQGLLLYKQRVSTGYVCGDGYKMIQVWNEAKQKSEDVREHRFVMEQHLRRPLFKHENVHHKNGQRTDNRIENLELWSRSQPCGQRVGDKLAWAHEFIKQYEGWLAI